MRLVVSFCCTALLFAFGLYAQGLDYVKSHYTKYEYRIPMRDGVRLFTAVYVPKDASERYPILLTRTPYSVKPYGADSYTDKLGPSEQMAKAGYIFAKQDVRGKYMSEGEFVNMRPYKPDKTAKEIDESSDAWDTIDWLIRNVPNNNGRAGMWGISYPGFYAAAGAIDAHPALKAVSPQAPIADWFVNDDFHHNGALFLVHSFDFLASFARQRAEPGTKNVPVYEPSAVDGYKFFLDMGPLLNADERFFKGLAPFWNELTRHPDYDKFWQERNLRPHLKNINPAVMTVGGWFDAEDLFGALKTYESIEKSTAGAANTLVMGPWVHGGWSRTDGDKLGDVSFGDKTSLFYREKIELPFFEFYLKQKGTPNLPEAYVFETGTNQWRREETWPPKRITAKTLYFHKGGKLSFELATQAGFDEYVSDPARPVPYVPAVAYKMSKRYMVEDQRFAATRPDVLVYQTEVLEDDVTLVGGIKASLHVSTSGTDSDWVVKLIDVYGDDYPNPTPNPAELAMSGYEQLVRGEPFRGRYRNGLDKPQAFVPGEPSKVEFTMPDVYHCFRRGHRIMVQVQSSWFPLVDRNPQKFVDIYQAREADFQTATQHVYFGGGRASSLTVGILDK